MIKNFVQFITEKKQDVDKKLIDEYGMYKIYSVSGKKVRDLTEKNEEFGLSYSHPYFPTLIPEKEIWIEDNVKDNERLILIYIELYKLKLIGNGMEKWDAYHKAENVNKKYREKLDKKSKKTNDDEIYIKEYCKIGEVVVWLVDAEIVRNKYKSDFMEGGHGYVYNWIPKNEIWIENGLENKEIPFVLLHEFVERTLMKNEKMKYDTAHDISAKVEWNKRPNSWSKNDIINLTEEKVLELVKKYKTK